MIQNLLKALFHTQPWWWWWWGGELVRSNIRRGTSSLGEGTITHTHTQFQHSTAQHIPPQILDP